MSVEEALECRECSAICEKVVYPAECLSANCRYLYSFKSTAHLLRLHREGLHHEIDLERFDDIERTKGGFGVVKMVRQPLEQCAVAVQSCYQCAEVPMCRNMYFRRRDRRPDRVDRGDRPLSVGSRACAYARSARRAGYTHDNTAGSPAVTNFVGGESVSTWSDSGRSSKPRCGGLVKLPEQHTAESNLALAA